MTPFDAFYGRKFMNHKNVKKMKYKSGRNPFYSRKVRKRDVCEKKLGPRRGETHSHNQPGN